MAPATGGTAPFAASVRGAPASSAVAAASAEAAASATSGNVPSAASVRGAVGARESSAGAVPSDAATEAAPSTDGIAAPAASTAREVRALALAAGSDGEICGERGASTHPFDRGTVCPLEVHHYNAAGCSMAAATTTPVITTPGGMPPALEHCCDPLIRGSDAGGARGEQKRF